MVTSHDSSRGARGESRSSMKKDTGARNILQEVTTLILPLVAAVSGCSIQGYAGKHSGEHGQRRLPGRISFLFSVKDWLVEGGLFPESIYPFFGAATRTREERTVASRVISSPLYAATSSLDLVDNPFVHENLPQAGTAGIGNVRSLHPVPLSGRAEGSPKCSIHGRHAGSGSAAALTLRK